MPDLNLNELVRTDFIVIFLALNALGGIIKYRTKINNEQLPLILFIVAFVSCALWGWFSSVYTGGARWADSLIMCGFAHGLVVSSLAVWGWDFTYGQLKLGLRRKSIKQAKSFKKKKEVSNDIS